MMNGDLLGMEIMAEVDSLSDEEKKDRENVFKAIGRAVVKHVQLYGQLQGIIVVGTATGVTAGPAAVPVAGTGTAPPGSIK